MRRFASTLATLLLAATPAFASGDGYVDAAYGQNAGRSLAGYVQSDTMRLRGIANYPQSGRIWLDVDDTVDHTHLYLNRLLANGMPDTGFGIGQDGQAVTPVPNGLITQTEAMSLSGVLLEPTGKPL